MLDGRWRATVERGLEPVGQGLHRAGITADSLTIIGLVFAIGTALSDLHPSQRVGGAGHHRWRSAVATESSNALVFNGDRLGLLYRWRLAVLPSPLHHSLE